MRQVLLMGLVAGMALATPVLAGDADIGARLTNGRVETWKVDKSVNPPVYDEPKRVFEGSLDLINGVVEGDEPGWYFDLGNPFAGFRVGFNVRKAARAWDPNGPSNFPGANFTQLSPVTFTIGNSILGQVNVPAVDPVSPIAGPSVLVPTSSVLDFHYPFLMNGNVPGIYLLELEAYSDRPGVQNSEPFWILLNYGLPSSELERAEEFVSTFIVPTPGAGVLLAAAGVGLIARRRR